MSGDSRVDTLDARLIAGFLVGSSTSVPHPENADVNNDGLITTADALLIMQVSKGLRTSFASNALEVLAVMPSSGTTGVQLTANFSVFFSEPVLSGTLGGISLTDTVTSLAVPGAFQPSQNGVIATFLPNQPLQPDRVYRIDVTTAVKDNGGHALTQPFTSSFRTQVLGTLLLVSTNSVSAEINTVLPSPITVKALSSGGTPVSQVLVVFVAQMGNGSFQPSGQRLVTVLTDGAGIAQLSYQTGSQALLNTVSITAVGFSTVPLFAVQTMPTPAVNLRLYTGDRQNGAAGTSPTFPLIVQATNAGGDSISGTTVTFSIVQGQGNFGGQSTLNAVTGSTGTASATFTFGATTGTVIVQASFLGMVGQAPQFTLFNLSPNPSSGTTIIGTVLDAQTLLPLAHVYTYLSDAPSIWDWTDEAGNFHLATTPGAHVVEVDGFESGPINGKIYPVVAIPVNAVEGQVNKIGMPALLPQLDPQSYIDVSGTQGGTLTLRSNPLWSMYVAPGSAHFANGTTTGRLYVADVPADKIPMPVAGGKISRFFDTIQPLNVQFDPPAPVGFPNSDNLPPGTVTEIFTLSYTSGTFTQTGRGKVSEDGLVIRSLPGQGITAGGWHNSPGPVPSPLYCIKALLKLGIDVISATMTAFGRSSAGSNVIKDLWSFLLCGLPSNQGPVSPILTVVADTADAPPVSGPGGGGNGGGGSGGGGSGSGGGPYSGNPDAPPQDPPDDEPEATITGLLLHADETELYEGESLQITVTVVIDDPTGTARKDGIIVRVIDTPANIVTVTGRQVMNVADFEGVTDALGQVTFNVLLGGGLGPPPTLPPVEHLEFTIDPKTLLKVTAAGGAAIGLDLLLKKRRAFEMDTIALQKAMQADPFSPLTYRGEDAPPVGVSILNYINLRRGRVFYSEQVHAEFIDTMQDPDRRNEALLFLARNEIVLTGRGPQDIYDEAFVSAKKAISMSNADAKIAANAISNNRRLITVNDTTILNHAGRRETPLTAPSRVFKLLYYQDDPSPPLIFAHYVPGRLLSE